MTPASAVRSRPAYRPYAATVAGVERLAPHFVRITLTGPDFDVFGTAGLDQRVKLMLPLADGTLSDVGQHDHEALEARDWYAQWRDTPAAERSPLRTYTVRRIHPDTRMLDIDFVVHPGPGPAGSWAEQARIGQEIVVVGPDERSEGRLLGLDWHPGTARRLLLAGDETALPAICSILESLDDAHVIDAFVEVPTAADVLEIALPRQARMTWLAREDRPHGAALTEAVAAWSASVPEVLAAAAAPRSQELVDVDVDIEALWESPEDSEGEFYAWIAGEAGMVKLLRRHLVRGCGVDRKRVAFMGYWRLGQSERQE